MTAPRKFTLGMEPSERRALEIMRVACEQSDEIASLQRALNDMTERCRAAELRVRNFEIDRAVRIVSEFPFEIPEHDCCTTEFGRMMARDWAMVRAFRSL